MKKYILILFLFGYSTLHAQFVSTAEYYFDIDPGVGFGIPVSGFAGSDSVSVNINIPLGNLSAGYHVLYIRSKDNFGKWGNTEGKLFNIYPVVKTVEYFFDNDPGSGNGTAIPSFNSNDSVNVNTSISVTGLNDGTHILYIRSRDNNGKWGIPEGKLFSIYPVVKAAEYFFDTDPGAGSGTAISAFSSGDSVNVNTSISVTGLNEGTHILYMRSRDNNGKWGNPESKSFSIYPVIKTAEYFFDTDPGAGFGTAIPAFASGDSVNVNASLSVTGLIEGSHILYIRSRDNNGKWGNPEGKSFSIYPVVKTAEYFFDTDPGAGSGTAIPAFTSGDSVNVNASLSVTGLSEGSHILYIRSRDNNGKWGNPEGKSFSIYPVVKTAEYFFDTDPGAGSGTVIPAFTSGDSVNVNASLSVTGLSEGSHILYIRSRDNNGKWGNPEGKSISIYPIVKTAEYFFDTDPGTGSGTAIPAFTSGDSVNVNANISVAGLSEGSHILYIRSRDNNGKWGNPEGKSISIYPIVKTAEYFFDTDPGAGNGTAIPVVNISDSVNINFTPSIAALTQGQHKLYIRSADNNGRWSNPEFKNFYIGTCVSTIVGDGPLTICSSGSVKLTASAGTSYNWSTGQTTGYIDVTTSGSYSCTITNQQGCQSVSNSLIVTVIPQPNAPLASVNSPVCFGDTIKLAASVVPGANYVWTGSNGYTSTLQNPLILNVDNSNNGTYKVKSVIGNCYSQFSNILTINVSPLPSPPAINSDSPLCEGATLHLTASTIAGTTYEWNGPTGIFSSQQNPVISNATLSANGSYFATTTLNGCKSISSNIINVEISPTPPSPIASANTTLLCEGNTLNLYATGEPDAIFSWTGPNAFLSSDQNPVITNAHDYESGNYSLQQYVGMCASSFSNVVNVLISPYPTSPAASSNSPVCSGQTLQLNADVIPGAAYFWSGPNFFSSNDQNPSIENVDQNANGDYALTVSVNGCESPQGVVATIGNGTGTNTNVTYPAPYGTWNYGARHQMMYRSTELTAAGLSAGSVITQMGFDVVNAEHGAVYQLFTMSIKNSSANDLSSGFEVMPVTNYNGGTVIPNTGWNIISLDYPFTWDGTSNIIVEVCNDADGNLGGSFNYNSLTRMTTGLPANTTRWRAQNMPCGGPPNESYGGVTTERPDIRFVATNSINVVIQPSPYISLFTPDNGGINSPVELDGYGFTDATSVTFNGVNAGFTVDNDNMVSASVPSGATDGPIQLTSATGCTATSSSYFLVTVSGFSMHLNLFIQGMYAGGGTMNSPLFNSGITTNPDECDSIVVELHDGSDPSIIVDIKTVMLFTDGHADIQFTNVPDGSLCYIVIKHRNSIETWSKDAFIFTNNSSFQYDFSHY